VPEPDAPHTLVIACGALAREVRAVLDQVPATEGAVTVTYLPAHLHNTPDEIPPAVQAAVGTRTDMRIVIAYADCGTGGRLDALVTRLGATRLPGAHCYELFAGPDRLAAIMATEPGTFFLTDFLARHFDALVVGTLGLDEHPELRDVYFANYRRVVLLAQSDDETVVAAGRRAATRLGLAFEHERVGLTPFRDALRVAMAG
jgi:hypothetical protein